MGSEGLYPRYPRFWSILFLLWLSWRSSKKSSRGRLSHLFPSKTNPSVKFAQQLLGMFRDLWSLHSTRRKSFEWLP